MNRIFNDHPSEGWQGFPHRSFARLESIEPQNFPMAGEAIFTFDAVDVNWMAGGLSNYLFAVAPQNLQSGIAEYWASLFRGVPPKAEPFDEIPLYSIDVTVRRGDAFWDTMLGLLKEDWISIELSAQGTFPVEVYGSLGAAVVSANLISATPAPAAESTILSTLFNIENWMDASEHDLRREIQRTGAIEKLALYDVGQGSALGLLNSADDARMFFDLGAGCYGNSHTRPRPLRFCWRGAPTVILSHWDADHWAGGSSDRYALAATWIAPRQPRLPPRHHMFAARILRSSGSLLIWGATAGSALTVSTAGHQTVTIGLCTGSDRNGTGIALLFDDSIDQRSWLLTGDAGYSEIPITATYDLSALAVPHHGGDMSGKGLPPARPGGVYTRLLYSFGPGNRHGKTNVRHPTMAAFNDHVKQGWSLPHWTSANIGLLPPGGDALTTANNPKAGNKGGSHLDSAAIGLSTIPPVPLSTLPCSTGGHKNGCTLSFVQN